MKQSARFIALVPFVTLVAGHGFVQNATIGGKEYDVRAPQIVSMASRQLIYRPVVLPRQWTSYPTCTTASLTRMNQPYQDPYMNPAVHPPLSYFSPQLPY
jgi:hypothetical protein